MSLYYASLNNKAYGTLELNADGVLAWTSLYPQGVEAISVGTALAVDAANNCYVTGYSPGTNGYNDIVTIKYGSNGNQIWLQRYNGPGNGNAAGNAIAVDNNGNVYVAGYDTTTAGGTEMVLIKYSPSSFNGNPTARCCWNRKDLQVRASKSKPART